ncbi:transketolase [Breznakiella homolactica]|uniref:Transketolase n=1 Tax=Breznakiella homolactica TaxID=2798577 RepID=A0A7T7XNS0_9SPIR|nr:transketolase [Breznakiella homolactica]QQO09642.1 transketolase [Breznakiella homolactica]
MSKSIAELTGYEKFWRPFRESTLYNQDVLPFHGNYSELLKNTETLAYLIRSYTVYEMTCASLGHPGGSMSQAEILAVLFNYLLRHDPADPGWENRDVLYLSKAHCCPALYTALALFGYFPMEELKLYGSWGSMLESHPDCTKTPGIEISGGSLGQIPGVAVGRALGMAKKGPDQANRMVYVIVGDGECNEGSVWEAFMAAGHYGLDNIVFIIDYNKVQAKGFVHNDMGIEPLADKLRAFGHSVFTAENGHNVSELIDLVSKLKNSRNGKPISVIANTIKGKKIAEALFNPNWHTSAPRDRETAAVWLDQLWQQDGSRLGVPRTFVDTLGKLIEKVPPLHGNPDSFSDAQA